ncbi:MAG: hypothetical protein KAI64_02025, partial [Thermoplasmata archaeon]|nr:hypothetical protein [Thermoplasmata archaeon]
MMGGNAKAQTCFPTQQISWNQQFDLPTDDTWIIFDNGYGPYLDIDDGGLEIDPGVDVFFDDVGVCAGMGPAMGINVWDGYLEADGNDYITFDSITGGPLFSWDGIYFYDYEARSIIDNVNVSNSYNGIVFDYGASVPITNSNFRFNMFDIQIWDYSPFVVGYDQLIEGNTFNNTGFVSIAVSDGSSCPMVGHGCTITGLTKASLALDIRNNVWDWNMPMLANIVIYDIDEGDFDISITGNSFNHSGAAADFYMRRASTDTVENNYFNLDISGNWMNKTGTSALASIAFADFVWTGAQSEISNFMNATVTINDNYFEGGSTSLEYPIVYDGVIYGDEAYNMSFDLEIIGNEFIDIEGNAIYFFGDGIYDIRDVSLDISYKTFIDQIDDMNYGVYFSGFEFGFDDDTNQSDLSINIEGNTATNPLDNDVFRFSGEIWGFRDVIISVTDNVFMNPPCNSEINYGVYFQGFPY